MNYKVYFDRKPWFQQGALYVVAAVGGMRKERFAVHSPVFQTVEPGTEFTPFLDGKQTMTFDQEPEAFLQAMLDCAWENGLRPTGFADHTNELKAVRDHLADMQKLVAQFMQPTVVVPDYAVGKEIK